LHPKEDIPTAITQGRFPAQLRLPDFYSPLPVQVQAWAAPWTYTGQDLVEVHLISSPPLVQSLLDHLMDRGARLADPGEFTLRAYLAGKLDLTQAEAVHALSTSADPDELRTALTQLAGGLARPLDALREEILLLLAEVEAGLDFADEDLTFIENDALAWRIDACRMALQDVQDQMRRQGRSKTQFRVVLAGPPNVGKSSLLNALAGYQRAIISSIPGTTRDLLSALVVCDGYPIEFLDSAGLRQSDDPLEQAGMARTQTAGDDADVILWLVDLHEPISSTPGLKPTLTIGTKADLPRLNMAPVDHFVSAQTGEDVAELLQKILRYLVPRETKLVSALALHGSGGVEYVRTI
jgi:tRNA modification GTPase